MALTIKQIRDVPSNDKLLDLLLDELKLLFPPELRSDPAAFLSRLQNAPAGFRAMAATYDLDVSMALDDLAWYFVNHHELLDLAEETIFGLRELEAPEAAEIFQEALLIIQPHWSKLTNEVQPKAAHDWLDATGLQALIDPLSKRLWNYLKQFPDNSFFSLWLAYARKYPGRCIAIAK
jgi:hypothetical protein